MASNIKQEPIELPEKLSRLSDVELNSKKKPRVEDVSPPPGFEPLWSEVRTFAVNTNNTTDIPSSSRALGLREMVTDASCSQHNVDSAGKLETTLVLSYKQFWKAGDYEGCSNEKKISSEDMDHLRVHPKFLHSNATTHKWALGALAELLDNALDEASNGATNVYIDVLQNIKDKSKMLLFQDNGGGMTPAKMRHCMSLGYSAKSKMAQTIGEYGNGFKTGTMRLGADVIVFSRCKGTIGESVATRSIGLLSYTFLRASRMEDIVVPMVDYERSGDGWNMYARSNGRRNLETILQWSPYTTEKDLLNQFNLMSEQGTRVIIYNLWVNEEGSLELDFDSDKYDIQIRGEGRDDPKRMEYARKHPSCRHFFTYRHSFRSYAAILYRTIPTGFRIILRGKDVDHYDIVDDLIHASERVYRPTTNGGAKDPNILPTKVTLGFVKASLQEHVDIQGFSIYHKNRLIEPFWRVWNAAGSNGRGIVGVVEASFIKPAHDKQGFERTSLLNKLESRLKSFQRKYWNSNKHLIGYKLENEASTSSPEMGNIRRQGSTPVITNVTPRAGPKSITSSSKPSIPPSVVPQLGRPVNESNVSTKNNEEKSASFSSVVDMVEMIKKENNSLSERLTSALQDLENERIKNKSLENQLEDMKKMLLETEKKLEEH